MEVKNSVTHSARMRDGAIDIIKRLRQAGYQAVLAGGCVRDQLRGLAPKDYDVATNASPIQVQALFPHSDAVGAHFGVILVRADGFHYEIATFRADGQYSDGRRPDEVRFTTAEEDAQRRDFTVNGLFYDPIDDQLIDYVGGQADLAQKVLRAIGDPAARFAEDHLRLMRAVRFATVLEFDLDPITAAAIKDTASSLAHIAVERVQAEFVKIITHPHRLRGFDLMESLGLLRMIVPEFEALKGCEQPPEFHPEGDVFTHTRLVFANLPADASPALALSALFHDIAKPATQQWDPEVQRFRFNGHDAEGAVMTEHILRRLKFDNDTIDSTTEAVANHMKFMHVSDMRTAKLKRFMARPNFETEMWLHRADCLGCFRELKNYDYLRAKQAEFASSPLIPPPLLTGRDLIDRGLKPSPLFSQLLEEIQTLQLEGTMTSREEALAWLDENQGSHLEP